MAASRTALVATRMVLAGDEGCGVDEQFLYRGESAGHAFVAEAWFGFADAGADAGVEGFLA